jgi:hypothetical protein
MASSSENYFEAWKKGTAPAPRALTAKEKKAQEEAALAKEPRVSDAASRRFSTPR